MNATENARRQRFTAAHELAHYLLHRELPEAKGSLARHDDMLFGQSAPNNPVQPFRPRHEVEANKLAAELIMPADYLKDHYVPEWDNIDVLTELFDVSHRAMELRLKNLGLRP